jgi:prophage antirepressor-like protein
MSNLTIFNNQQFGEIRTVTIDGEPWLVGKDVAEILGFKNPRQALATNVDDEDRGVHAVDTPSGVQNMTVINESGLLSLVLSSKLPSAKAFKRWVTSEVLPSIRKTGGYQMQTNKPIKMSEVFQAMAQTAKIAEDASETAHAAMNGVTRLTAAQDAIEASVSSMDKKLDNVVDVLSAPKTTEAERWQRETHKAITSFCQENKLSYRDFYDNLYEQLEERAHVNLSSRVTRRQNRARWEGASRTEIYRITKLFMVSIDPKLRLIFDSLVTEFKIAYALKGATT